MLGNEKANGVVEGVFSGVEATLKLKPVDGVESVILVVVVVAGVVVFVKLNNGCGELDVVVVVVVAGGGRNCINGEVVILADVLDLSSIEPSDEDLSKFVLSIIRSKSFRASAS